MPPAASRAYSRPFRAVALGQTAVWVLAVAWPLPAIAGEWRFNSNIGSGLRYSDNLSLERVNPNDGFTGTLTGSGALTYERAAFEAALTGAVELSGYSDNDDLSSVDETISLRTVFKNERGALRLGAEYRSDTILANEDDNTGTVGRATDVETVGGSLGWEHRTSPRDTLNAGLNFSTRAYEDPGRIDYAFYQASASWSHAISETLHGKTSLTAGRFEEADGTKESNTILGLRFGVAYDASRRVKFDASFGPRLVLVDDPAPGADDELWGYGADVSVDYDVDDVTRVRFTLGRNVEPSGAGLVTDRDRIRFFAERDLSGQLSANISIAYVMSDFEDAPSADRVETSLTIEPALNWKLAPDWSLKIGYQYRQQEFELGDEADSNSVRVGLSYRLPPVAWSD